MTTLYPVAHWKPVVNHGGPMSEHLGLVLHVVVGDGSPYNYFNTPGVKASSTWWASKTGAIEQYVDASLEAWAQAAGNATYNSVETEGFPDQPLNNAQIQAIAHLYAWGHTTYKWPLQVTNTVGLGGLATHKMGGTAWSPDHHNCPGDIRTAQRQAIIDSAKSIVSGNVPTLDATDIAAVTNAVWSRSVQRTVNGVLKPIAAIQELADSKSLGIQNQALIKSLQAQVTQLQTAVNSIGPVVHDIAAHLGVPVNPGP